MEVTMKSSTPLDLWNPRADNLESFMHVLAAAAAAKDSHDYDIDYLMDSVSASKGKTLLPVSMILDVSSLLSRHALHKTWCMKVLKAMDIFPLPLCVFGIRQICESIVETLQKRLSIDHKSVDDKEYAENFVDYIPHELVGYEGIWKAIFSYHYSSKEENYQVLKKGFKLMNTFASYYPVDLALVGAAETLIETTEMFINRADFVELAADVMSRLVYVDWQRDLTTNRSRLLDSGICELCMKLLNKYVTSTPIACHCLMTIHNLGQCSTPNIQIKLCESGACESIVNALRENCRTCGSNDELDIGVAASGLMAIDALTDHFGNEHIVVRETISKFVDAGLCEVLISVLEKYAKNCEIQFDWTLQDDNAIESVLDCGQGVIRNLARRNELVRNRLKHLGAGNWLPELF